MTHQNTEKKTAEITSADIKLYGVRTISESKSKVLFKTVQIINISTPIVSDETELDKIIHNDFLWIYEIIPYLDPRLFRINELKSISQRFKKLIPDCKHKSKYIRVPSEKFPTLPSAYDYIETIMYNFYLKKKFLLYKNKYKYCVNNHIIPLIPLIPPEIWLDEGYFDNSIDTIREPIVIRGMGMNRTIITHGLKFDINEKVYQVFLNLKMIIDSLSINNIRKSNNHNDYFDGISGKSDIFINICSCKIEKCNGSGISSHKIKLNIRNSVICNNKNTGVHIFNKSILLVNDLEIFHCAAGILIGNTKLKEGSLLNDIYIHHNDGCGLSTGGWDPDADVIVTGNKTDISYNNLIAKHKYIYGVSTDYSGKLTFIGLDKNVSHNNYNDQDINSRHGSEIIFTS